MTYAVQLKDNLGSADTSRAYSPGIWGDCPTMSIRDGSIAGMVFEDDFDTGGLITSPTASAALAGLPYSGFGSTGSSHTYASELGGAIQLLSDGTDNDGTSIFPLQTSFQCALTKGPLWFEARIKVSNIVATGVNFFVGLCDNTAKTAVVPLTATDGALADLNCVGFRKPESELGSVLTCYKADGETAVDVQTITSAIAAATYVKLGFKKDSDGLLTFYINNLPQSSTFQLIDDTAAASNSVFPADAIMGPCAALEVGAVTGNQTLIMDWWKCVQVA